MKIHCCTQMANVCQLNCDQHNDAFECPDVLISYNEKFDEYGIIIRDGGSALSMIYYCPYCGAKLPSSKRDLWFSTLEKMGFYDPVDQSIPDEYKSSEWYKEFNL